MAGTLPPRWQWEAGVGSKCSHFPSVLYRVRAVGFLGIDVEKRPAAVRYVRTLSPFFEALSEQDFRGKA